MSVEFFLDKISSLSEGILFSTGVGSGQISFMSQMRFTFFILSLCLGMSLSKAEEPEQLSPRQQAWVDAVYNAGIIVDPTGATRVQVLIPHHSQWGGTYDAWKDAWLFPQADGKDPVYLSTTGLSIPNELQKEVRTVPFALACRARILSSTLNPHDLGLDTDRVEETLAKMVEGADDDHPYTLAAWLAKTGEINLAKELFQKRRAKLGPLDLDEFKESLAHSHYMDMVDAFVNHNDTEAERQMVWLKQRFPAQYIVERRLFEQEFSRRKKNRPLSAGDER